MCRQHVHVATVRCDLSVNTRMQYTEQTAQDPVLSPLYNTTRTLDALRAGNVIVPNGLHFETDREDMTETTGGQHH